MMEPPPILTVSQWADVHRRLSSESSAEPGRWDTSRAEYQRGVMDSLNDPLIDETIVMTSSQIGKTEILNNIAGYYIENDPAPMLVMNPTDEIGEAWSKDRFSPMCRDTPSLKSIIADPKSRSSGNTITHKLFPGGHLTIVGANSPSSLASRPIRILLCDEVDRYPVSAGTEGDPFSLARKRTTAFWNRRVAIFSTPTIKGFSRIEEAFKESDQRRFFVPCPHCDHRHVLAWGNVKWEKGDPSTARMECPECEKRFTNAQKNAAVRLGEWMATAEFKGKAGFHLNELYSPWKRLEEVVADFLASQGNPSRLQVWVNTSLGETWEESGERVSDHELMDRLEEYPAEVPKHGLFLTAGVDTQPDRLEVEVVAWGKGEESWSIDYHVIHGDPDIPEGTHGSPWTDLTEYLRKPWKHESGSDVAVSGTFIDSGGANTQAVYGYVRNHKGQRIFAIKGQGGEGVPIVGNRQKRRSGKTSRTIDFVIVGVDNAKTSIMRKLQIKEPGAGYCHFPKGREPEYFRQLTAEKLVTRFVKGFPRREWQKESGRRNEAIDCRVYAFAAFVMASPRMDKIAFKIIKSKETPNKIQVEPESQGDKPAQEKIDPIPQSEVSKKPSRPKRRNNWINKWR